MSRAVHLASCALHLRRELVDITEDGHAGVGEACPAGHLDDHGAAGVCQDVAGVDGQGAEAEDGLAGPIAGKVHQRAKGVPRPPMVHGAHHRAQVCICGLLHLVTMQ